MPDHGQPLRSGVFMAAVEKTPEAWEVDGGGLLATSSTRAWLGGALCCD